MNKIKKDDLYFDLCVKTSQKERLFWSAKSLNL